MEEEEEGKYFPFRLLRNEVYLTIDILMYLERSLVLQIIFGVNKATRFFLLHNYNSIKNGFINEGLIIYDLDCKFRGFE